MTPARLPGKGLCRAGPDQSKAQAVVVGNLAIAHIRQSSRDVAVARLHQAIDVTEHNRGGGGPSVILGAGRTAIRRRYRPRACGPPGPGSGPSSADPLAFVTA